MRWWILLVLMVALPQERHDQYKEDAQAYCYTLKTSGSLGPYRQRDPHAHACACHLVCQRSPDNEIVGDQESPDCQLWCSRDRCFCHVESPCEGHH